MRPSADTRLGTTFPWSPSVSHPATISSCNAWLISSGRSVPFGGVGDSGWGSYHGWEGFKTFSHEKGKFCCDVFARNETSADATTAILEVPF